MILARTISEYTVPFELYIKGVCIYSNPWNHTARIIISGKLPTIHILY